MAAGWTDRHGFVIGIRSGPVEHIQRAKVFWWGARKCRICSVQNRVKPSDIAPERLRVSAGNQCLGLWLLWTSTGTARMSLSPILDGLPEPYASYSEVCLR